MHKQDVKQVDEREYYRIDDAVEFSYYLVPENRASADFTEADLKKHLFEHHAYEHFQLIKQLRAIDIKSYPLFLEISQQNPSLAEYLNIINEKMMFINNAFFKAFERPAKTLNLSAGGCAFSNREELAEGTRLKIKLILRPSFHGIITSGVVVSSRYLPNTCADNPYKISLKFTEMSEDDRQMIQQHIIKKQSKNLQIS